MMKLWKKNQKVPYAPENRKFNPDNFTPQMKKIKPCNYTRKKNLICDWTDKMKCLIHFRMLKFYVRHGMIVDKSCKRSLLAV